MQSQSIILQTIARSIFKGPRQRYAFFIAALFLTALLAPPSLEAQQEVLLPGIVVTATRTPSPLETTGSSVIVLTQEDLKAAGTELLDALRRVPGLTVVGSGSRGGRTSVFARGGQSDYNLVLIDGVKINNAGGDVDFSDLTIDNIERVEILLGPQSALYGADAMSSVIQIFTKRGRGTPTGEYSIFGGNFETFENRASIQFGKGNFGFSAGAGLTNSAGNLPINNGYRNLTASSLADYAVGDWLKTQVSLRYTKKRFEFPTGSAGDRFGPLDPNQFGQTNRLVVSPRVEAQVLPWWKHVLQIGYYKENRKFDDPADLGIDLFGSFRSDTDEERISADYLWHFGPWSAKAVEARPTIGFAAEEESFDQISVSAGFPITLDRTRTNYAVFGQVQLSFFERLFITPGVRHDDNDSFGSETSPRVSAAYLIPEWGTTLRGVYAKGIKAPTFFEVFGGFGVNGNPNLGPEKSKSIEAGFDQDVWNKRARFGFTFFYNKFTDLITFVAGSGPNFVNIQEAKAKGVEATLTVLPGFGVTLLGTYTYTNTEVLEDGGVGGAGFAKGQALIRRPMHRGSFQVGYEDQDFRGNLTLLVVGDSDDLNFSAFPATRVTLAGYQRVDLFLSYRLPWQVPTIQAIRLELRVQNLLDESYQEVFGFTAPGATVLGGIRLEFGSRRK
jgi:vitamin B12 transporter